MAEERKKPKIDLKSRIPSKTVKGLTPVAGGAIPPPPGAVPAPPPDLLGTKRPAAPRVTADPTDPLGAAAPAPAAPVPAQPIIVVAPSEGEGGAAHGVKSGVFYTVVGVAVVAGLGIGFVSGLASKGSSIATKARADAVELQTKVTKTNEALEKFADTLKSAVAELDNRNHLEPATVDAIKTWRSGFGVPDLKEREMAYFGADTAGKLLNFAFQVNHLDQMVTDLGRGNRLNAQNERLKTLYSPPSTARYGVQLSKPSADAPWTSASLVDLGEALNLKAKDIVVGDLKREPKLKAKAGELEIMPTGGEKAFLDHNYVSLIDSKDWMKSCPVYNQALSITRGDLEDLRVAIEGQGDDPGTLKPGKDLADKLKSIAK